MASWYTNRGFRLRELRHEKGLVDIQLDDEALALTMEAFKRLPAIASATVERSIKRTQGQLRRTIVSELKKTSTLTSAYASKAIRADRLKKSGNEITAHILSAKHSLPLIRFAVFPSTPPVLKNVPISRRAQLKYKLERAGAIYNGDSIHNQPTMLSRGGTYSKAFVQKMKSGHIGVFFRHEARGDIMQAYGPRVNFFLHSESLVQRLNQQASSKFMREFRKEFNLLSGINI